MSRNLHALDQRRLIDTNGIADGASIYFYQAGTLTPATVYTSFTGASAHEQPIVVAAGAAVPDIYLDPTVTYRRRIVYTDGSVDDTDPYNAPFVGTAALADTNGAGLVGYEAPYTDAVATNIGGKFNDLVSVTDFGSVASSATDAFTKAFAAASEYGRDLYIPKLDAGAKYAIEGDLLVPTGMKMSGGGSGSGTPRADPGSLLEFTDGALLCTDAAGMTFENFQLARVGTVGPALDFAGSSVGSSRNFLNNVSIIGSTGVGARFSGAWLLTWINPYVRACADIGILVEEGILSTGMNSMTLIGGEIQGNTNAGIVLDLCKQFNIVGTAIEGNGMGIGLGKSASAVSILAYMEANYDGHIMPYSHNGGSSGTAQCVIVRSGSQIYKGSSGPDTTIHIPRCRQFHMEPGVWCIGYAGNTAPLVQVGDVGDSNRAYGSIKGISVDAPADMVLQNDALYFGEETRRYFYVNATTDDAANSAFYKLPLSKGSTLKRNPSTTGTIIYHLDVTTGGNVVLADRRFDSAGVQIGSNVVRTLAVTAGYNRVNSSFSDSDNISYMEVWRAGSAGGDTAVGVTITAVEVLTYENPVKNA